MTEPRPLTPQAQRVYSALLEHPGGITRADFSFEPTIDGGETIGNVNAEIFRCRPHLAKLDLDADYDRKARRWHIVSLHTTRRKRKKKKVTTPGRDRLWASGGRIAELKARAESNHGDYGIWQAKRKRLMQLAREAAVIEPMVFWRNVPEDEIEEAWNEVLDVYETTARLIAAGEARLHDERMKETLEKLQTTNGRTAAEIATAERLVERKREKADIDYLVS